MCSKDSIYTNYKSLARRIVFAMTFLFFMAINVSAETITYNVCKTGCEYSDLDQIKTELGDISEITDIVINFQDNSEYYINEFFITNNYINNVEISGKNNILKINNLKIEYKKLMINNIQLETMFVDLIGKSSNDRDQFNNTEMLDYIKEKKYLENIAILRNVKSSTRYFFSVQYSKIEVYDSNIEFAFLNPCSETNFYHSNINGTIYNNKFDHIEVTSASINLYNYNSVEKIIRINLDDPEAIENYYNDSVLEEDDSQLAILSSKPTNIPPEYYEFSSALENHVFVYQETFITIKTDYNIDELEKSFINTYDNNYGYDYIKNQDISWISKDNKIAIVQDDKVIPLKTGMVDLEGTRGDDIYIVHLKIEPTSYGIIKKVEPQTKNYAEADFSSSDLNSVIPLTNEEQTSKESGKNIDVFLEVKGANETVAKEEKKLIEEKVENDEKLATYLDVSLFKQVEGEEASKIEKTNRNIKVSLNVPEDLINKDNKIKRTYYILRLHEGVVDKLDTNFDGKVLTFETDRFSTYALTYKDEVINGVNNPKTGDNIIKYMGILFGSIMMIVFIQVSKLRKE